MKFLIFPLLVITSLCIIYGSRSEYKYIIFIINIIFFLIMFSAKKIRPYAKIIIIFLFSIPFYFWWISLTPTNDGDWKPEFRKISSIKIEDQIITINNLRNFTWNSYDNFEESWEKREYNINDIESMYYFSTVLLVRPIAHTFISFGFSNGDYISFSFEARRKNGQFFNGLDGIFKHFELALVVSTEEDILSLRGNIKNEEITLYEIELNKEDLIRIFTNYSNYLSLLSENPEFYNTITNNCTNKIFEVSDFSNLESYFDWRVLVNGFTPYFLHEVGLINEDTNLKPFMERSKINDLILSVNDRKEISRIIRNSM